MEAQVVNKREIARYLGFKHMDMLDSVTDALIDECISEASAAIEPKACYDTFPIIWDEGSIRFASIETDSKALMKNLLGCDTLVMMAATIGPGVDRLIRRAEVMDMTRAYVLQCVGTQMIEEWCDKVGADIRDKYIKEGLTTRPRFSPGYGDFPLEVQTSFARVLNMRREIGVSLSSGVIMTPTKSVTAVIGLAPKEVSAAEPKQSDRCNGCNMYDNCDFARRE